MSARLEEIVVDANLIEFENFSKYLRKQLFIARAWRNVSCC